MLTAPRVELLGMPLSPVRASELLTHMSQCLERGEGGWVVTANLDILGHFRRDPVARGAYLAADIRVADGMPLVWASRLQGAPLPERVAGSTFCEALIAEAASKDAPVFFLGGQAGSAERAAERYRSEVAGLKIAALSALTFSSPPNDEQVESAVGALVAHGSKVVLVGLGSPKQELLIQRLRTRLPEAWFVGVGGSFRFWAGEIQRAPRVVQGLGLEWLHRLAQEPRRLGKRYLVDNLPLFFLLMANATRARISNAKPPRGR